MINASQKILITIGEQVVRHWRKGKERAEYRYPSQGELRELLIKMKFTARQSNNALHYLYRRGYLLKITAPKEDKSIIKLTAKGAMQFLKYCPLVTNEKLGEGDLSIVVLEIPEASRQIRDFLRHRLTDNGFRALSGGVYVCDRVVHDNFAFLIYLYKLKERVSWGRFMPSADTISIED
jgi:DNA-binding transcriptional regulator PaaX